MNLLRVASSARTALCVAAGLMTGVCVLLAGQPAAAFPVELEALPLNAPLGGLPANVPTTIPRKEQLTGLFAARPLGPYYGKQHRGVTLYASEEQVHALNAVDGAALATQRKDTGTCFLVAAPTAVNEPDKLRGWDTSGERTPSVSSYEGYRSVGAVRMERFVEAEGKHFLDVTDFWIDTVTGGTRRFGAYRLEFKEVARPYDGVVLYAARTMNGHVDVLLRSFEGRLQKQMYEKLGQEAALLLQQSGYPDSTIMVGDQGLFRNGCGQQRVRLELPALGAPPLIAAEPQFRAGKAVSKVINLSELEPQATRPPNSAAISLTPLTAWENGPDAERTRFGTLRGFQTRPLMVNVGLSRTSADAGPLLSVSYRWVSAPSRIQVVTPEPDGDAQLIDLGQ